MRNQRIQELAEQAEKYADDNFRGEPTWSEAFESKFAELIVRQCCFELTQESMKLDPTQPMSLLCLTSNATDRMMKYFGVEK